MQSRRKIFLAVASASVAALCCVLFIFSNAVATPPIVAQAARCSLPAATPSSTFTLNVFPNLKDASFYVADPLAMWRNATKVAVKASGSVAAEATFSVNWVGSSTWTGSSFPFTAELKATFRVKGAAAAAIDQSLPGNWATPPAGLSNLKPANLEVVNASVSATLPPGAFGCIFPSLAEGSFLNSASVAATFSLSADRKINVAVTARVSSASSPFGPVLSLFGPADLAVTASISSTKDFSVTTSVGFPQSSSGIFAGGSLSLAYYSRDFDAAAVTAVKALGGKPNNQSFVLVTASLPFCFTGTCTKPLQWKGYANSEALYFRASIAECLSSAAFFGDSNFEASICNPTLAFGAKRGASGFDPQSLELSANVDFASSAFASVLPFGSGTFSARLAFTPPKAPSKRYVIKGQIKANINVKQQSNAPIVSFNTVSAVLDVDTSLPSPISPSFDVGATFNLIPSYPQKVSAVFAYNTTSKRITTSVTVIAPPNPSGLALPIASLTLSLTYGRKTVDGKQSWGLLGYNIDAKIRKTTEIFNWLSSLGVTLPFGDNLGVKIYTFGTPSGSDDTSYFGTFKAAFPLISFPSIATAAVSSGQEVTMLNAAAYSSAGHALFGLEFALPKFTFPKVFPLQVESDKSCNLYILVTSKPALSVSMLCPLQLDVPSVGRVGPVFDTSASWITSAPTAIMISGSPRNGKIYSPFGINGLVLSNVALRVGMQVGSTPSTTLSSTLEFQGAMFGLQKVLGVSIPVNIQVTQEKVEFSGGVRVTFPNDFPLVAGELAFVFRTTFLPPPPSISIGGRVSIQVRAGSDPSQYPTFSCEMLYTVTTTDLNLDGKMTGTWNEPFGIRGLSLSDVSLGASINLAQAAATLGVGAISRLDLQGKVQISNVWAVFKIRFSTTRPLENCLIAEMSHSLTLIDVMHFGVKLILSQAAPNVPEFPVPITFRDILISISASDITIADKFYPAGLQLRARAVIFGEDAAEAGVSFGASGIRGYLRVAPIKVGQVFVLAKSSAEQNQGPFVDLDISFVPPRGTLKAAGYLMLLGGTAEANLEVTFDSFSLSASLNRLFGLPFSAAVTVDGKWSLSGAGVRIRGTFENHLSTTVINDIVRVLDGEKGKADSAIGSALRDLESAQREVDKAQRDVDKAYEEFNRARDKVDEAKRGLDGANAEIDRVCSYRHCGSVCVPGKRWDGCSTTWRICWVEWFFRGKCEDRCVGGLVDSGCLTTITDPGCVLLNTGCTALKETAKLGVKAAQGILDGAKGVLSAAESTKVIADGALAGAKETLKGTGDALGKLRDAYKECLAFGQWVTRLGGSDTFHIDRITFDFVAEAGFNGNQKRTLSVTADGLLANRVAFSFHLQLDLSDIPSFAKSLFNSMMDLAKDTFEALSRGLAVDPSTHLPVLDDTLRAALAECDSADTACIERFAHLRAARTQVLNAIHPISTVATLGTAQSEGGAMELAAAPASSTAVLDNAVETAFKQFVERLPQDLRANASSTILKLSSTAVREALRDAVRTVNSFPAGSPVQKESVQCLARMIADGATDQRAFNFTLRRCVSVIDKDLVKALSNSTNADVTAAETRRATFIDRATNANRADVSAALAALKAKYGDLIDPSKESQLTAAQKEDIRATFDKFKNKTLADVSTLYNSYTANQQQPISRALNRAAKHVMLTGLREGAAEHVIAALLKETARLPLHYVNARIVDDSGKEMDGAAIDKLSAEIAAARGLQGRTVSLAEAADMLATTDLSSAGAVGGETFAWGDMDQMMQAIGEQKLVLPKAVKMSPFQWLWEEDGGLNAHALATLMMAPSGQLEDVALD